MHELMATIVVSRQFILNELYRPLVQGADFLTFFWRCWLVLMCVLYAQLCFNRFPRLYSLVHGDPNDCQCNVHKDVSSIPVAVC